MRHPQELHYAGRLFASLPALPIAVAAIIGVACGTTALPGAGGSTQTGFKSSPARTESVSLRGTGAAPGTWHVAVKVELSNSCMRVGDTSVEQSDTGVTVTVDSLTPTGDVACDQALKYEEVTVPLPRPLSNCVVYEVRANGETSRTRALLEGTVCDPNATPARTTATVQPPQPDVSGVQDVRGLQAELARRGIAVRSAQGPAEGFFTFRPTAFSGNGRLFEVYEFVNAAQAQAARDKVSRDGSSYLQPDNSILTVTWEEPPHFYQVGNLIVIVVGRDAALLDALTALSGGQFAGG